MFYLKTNMNVPVWDKKPIDYHIKDSQVRKLNFQLLDVFLKDTFYLAMSYNLKFFDTQKAH